MVTAVYIKPCVRVLVFLFVSLILDNQDSYRKQQSGTTSLSQGLFPCWLTMYLCPFLGLVLGLVTQIPHSGATSLPQALVRLPSLLDTLAAIASRTDRVGDILYRQRHLLATPQTNGSRASPKEALASVTEVLRAELVRQASNEVQSLDR